MAKATIEQIKATAISEYMSERGKKGALAKNSAMTPEERSAHAKRMAETRHQKVRTVNEISA